MFGLPIMNPSVYGRLWLSLRIFCIRLARTTESMGEEGKLAS